MIDDKVCEKLLLKLLLLIANSLLRVEILLETLFLISLKMVLLR